MSSALPRLRAPAIPGGVAPTETPGVIDNILSGIGLGGQDAPDPAQTPAPAPAAPATPAQKATEGLY